VEVWPNGDVRLLAERAGDKGAGHDGVVVQSGQVEEEHNLSLQPEFWRGCDNDRGIADKILAEDCTAQAIRFARILPLSSTRFFVHPYTDKDGTVQPWAQEHADFLEACLFAHMYPGWTETLAQMVEFSFRGARYFEPIFRRDRELDRVVVERLALRPLRSVENWMPGRQGWDMEQAPPEGDGVGFGGGYKGPIIKARDLIGFRFFPQGSNPEPQGLMRPWYGPWKRRATYARLEVQGANRGAFGVPVITIDPSVPGFKPADRAEMNAIAREFRAGVRAYASEAPGYSLRFEKVPVDLKALRDSYNADGREMARAGLANHLFTGEDNGTQSLFTGQFGGMFKQSLQHDANLIAAVLSEGPFALARRLIALNFGKQPGYPTIVADSVPVGDPLAVVQAVGELVDKKILGDGDRAIEDHIREALSLPERPEPAAGPLNPDEPPPGTSGPSGDETRETRDTDDDEAARDDAGAVEGETPELEALSEGMEPPLPRMKAIRAEDRVYVDRLTAGPFGRPLYAAEECIRFSETAGVTTQGKSAVAREVQDWTERIAPAYAEAVEAAKAGGLDAVMSVPVPRIDELREDLVAKLRDVYTAGTRSASQELRRIERSPELQRRIEEGRIDRGEDGDLPDPMTLADGVPTSFKAPQAVIEAMRVGLQQVADGHGGDGLKQATVDAARRIVQSGRVSAEKVEEMGPWLARHEVDKQGKGFNPGEDGYPSPGRVAWNVWGGDSAVPFARRAIAQLKRARGEKMADDPSKTPAEPSERIRGSSRNRAGSASGSRGGIAIGPEQEAALRNKVEEHNEGRSDSRRVDLGKLKAVYRRGAGAFSTSHRPGMSRQQWAMARVNSFLRRVKGDGGHKEDDDLLPSGHPQAMHEDSCACCGPIDLLVRATARERVAVAAAWCQPVALAETPVSKPTPAEQLPSSDLDAIDPEEAIQAIASTTARAQANRIRTAVVNALQGLSLAGSLDRVNAAAAALETTLALSPGAVLNQAQSDVNTVFGLGRQQEQRAEGVELYMYSNLLESNTCEPCAELDGLIFGPERLDELATPYAGCDGGARCNCLIIGLPPERN
jgi:hypothetical protein